MDFRGNLEAGGSEDFPEAYTPCGLTITQDGDEPISGIGTGSQETEGEYYGAEIDLLIATGQTKELWNTIQRWFQQDKGHTQPPTS